MWRSLVDPDRRHGFSGRGRFAHAVTSRRSHGGSDPRGRPAQGTPAGGRSRNVRWWVTPRCSAISTRRTRSAFRSFTSGSSGPLPLLDEEEVDETPEQHRGQDEEADPDQLSWENPQHRHEHPGPPLELCAQAWHTQVRVRLTVPLPAQRCAGRATGAPSLRLAVRHRLPRTRRRAHRSGPPKIPALTPSMSGEEPPRGTSVAC